MIEDRDGFDEPRISRLVTVLLSLVAIGGAADLYLDQPSHWFTAHVLVELALMFASGGTAIYLAFRWNQTARSLALARVSLAEREAERDRWKGRAEASLQGLKEAIDEQLVAWALTPAEREVALLLLQGMGHKQIAGATGRSERTVRQHAVSVYQKSGLGGRAELSAYFLEGLR